MIQGRNTNIDCAKAIAAFFVVFIHVSFPGQTGIRINAISRFSVSLFFIVSGYFAFSPGDRQSCLRSLYRQMIKITRMIIFSTTVYLVYSEAVNLPYKPCGLGSMALTLLLFNKPSGIMTFSDPLWFLYALLYCHMAMGLMIKTNSTHWARPLLFSLFSAHFIIRETFRFLFPEDSFFNMFFIVRNFALLGLPFYLSGYHIHKKESFYKQLPNKWLILGVLLSIPLTLLELWISGRNSVYIGTSVCALSIMIFCTNNTSAKPFRWLATIGLHYSALIYIIHPIVWSVLPFLFFHLGIWTNTIMPWLIPFVVIGVSLFCSFIVAHIHSTATSRRQRRPLGHPNLG